MSFLSFRILNLVVRNIALVSGLRKLGLRQKAKVQGHVTGTNA
jgi:hypothetical protein